MEARRNPDPGSPPPHCGGPDGPSALQRRLPYSSPWSFRHRPRPATIVDAPAHCQTSYTWNCHLVKEIHDLWPRLAGCYDRCPLDRAPMKAVILVGGEGTRLRPLTLGMPKPVVPVVDRPFLRHQLELLGRVGIREVVFSVAYRPERIQALFGDGHSFGLKIRYAFEETPLGTGGAVKNAEPDLDERTIVLNGDVLTDVDLPGIVTAHAAAGASATIVLAPVPNPAAYGLVETDAGGRVLRFLEKPDPSQITTDTINAGVYVLETRVLELVPPRVNHSIERAFFPALLARWDPSTAATGSTSALTTSTGRSIATSSTAASRCASRASRGTAASSIPRRGSTPGPAWWARSTRVPAVTWRRGPRSARTRCSWPK